MELPPPWLILFVFCNAILMRLRPVLCLVDETVFTCSKPSLYSQTLPAPPCPTASVGHPPHSRWGSKLWHFVRRERMLSAVLPNSLLKEVNSYGLLVLCCENPFAVLLDHWRLSNGTVANDHHLSGKKGKTNTTWSLDDYMRMMNHQCIDDENIKGGLASFLDNKNNLWGWSLTYCEIQA